MTRLSPSTTTDGRRTFAAVSCSGRPAARRLVGFGILAALPTAATGLSDWHDTYDGPRRLGVAHMLANSAALALQVASWRARGRGHHIRGALLGAAGLGAVTAGG